MYSPCAPSASLFFPLSLSLVSLMQVYKCYVGINGSLYRHVVHSVHAARKAPPANSEYWQIKMASENREVLADVNRGRAGRLVALV